MTENTSKTFRIHIDGYGEWAIRFPDTSWFTEEWVSEWKSFFYPYDELKEYAEHIIYNFGVLGERTFIEGYGPLKYKDGNYVLSIGDKNAEEIGTAIITTGYLDSPDIEFDTEEI